MCGVWGAESTVMRGNSGYPPSEVWENEGGLGGVLIG